MKNIPLFYFPTKIVMIDDYVPFLASMSLVVGDHTQTFDDPVNALTVLKTYTAAIQADCLMTLEQASTDFFDSLPAVFQLANMRDIIANREKSQDISVVIVDYHMPTFNGLQLLASVNDQVFKKILLTAEADDEAAIEAFNHQLIHQFIRKNSRELAQKLNASILNLKQDYFIDLTANMMKALPYVQKMSKDENVIKHFQQTLVERAISEYYLIDDNGIYLLINEHGESLYYLIYNAAQLKLLAHYAENDGATEKTVEELAACQKIPCFLGKKYWDIEAGHWGGFLHVPSVIVGKETYYVAVVGHPNQAS